MRLNEEQFQSHQEPRFGVEDTDDPDIVSMQVGKSAQFTKRQVPVAMIPHHSYQDWADSGHSEDIDQIAHIYRHGGEMPPVVLDHKYGVLDGGHRVSGAAHAGLKHIEAFVHDPAP